MLNNSDTEEKINIKRYYYYYNECAKHTYLRECFGVIIERESLFNPTSITPIADPSNNSTPVVVVLDILK